MMRTAHLGSRLNSQTSAISCCDRSPQEHTRRLSIYSAITVGTIVGEIAKVRPRVRVQALDDAGPVQLVLLQ